jgi:hypothetical protein
MIRQELFGMSSWKAKASFSSGFILKLKPSRCKIDPANGHSTYQLPQWAQIFHYWREKNSFPSHNLRRTHYFQAPEKVERETSSQHAACVMEIKKAACKMQMQFSFYAHKYRKIHWTVFREDEEKIY